MPRVIRPRAARCTGQRIVHGQAYPSFFSLPVAVREGYVPASKIPQNEEAHVDGHSEKVTLSGRSQTC